MSKKDPLAALDKKLDAGETPKTLSKEEHKALLDCFGKFSTGYFKFPKKSYDSSTLLNEAFADALKKAKVFGDKMEDPVYELDAWSHTIMVHGNKKASDAYLISAYRKKRKEETKRLAKTTLTEREAAILTINALKKKHEID